MKVGDKYYNLETSEVCIINSISRGVLHLKIERNKGSTFVGESLIFRVLRFQFEEDYAPWTPLIGVLL